MPQNLSKTVTIIQFLPYIALNIGHGDLVSGMQLAVPNIMYIHHTSGTWKQKWLQEKGKPSKWVKITNVLANISCNIGHGDLVSGMQIDVPNIMHIHHTWRSCVKKCPNVPPKFTDGRQTTDASWLHRLTQVSQKLCDVGPMMFETLFAEDSVLVTHPEETC